MKEWSWQQSSDIVCSSDFEHDVCFHVSGDWGDDQLKVEYLEYLTTALNTYNEELFSNGFETANYLYDNKLLDYVLERNFNIDDVKRLVPKEILNNRKMTDEWIKGFKKFIIK